MDYRYLKNIRNLNAFFRGATSSEIKSILEKLTTLYENVKSQEEAVLKEKQEREAFLSSVLNSLDSHNYTIDDLAALKGLKTNKAKMKPRYEYVDLNGETQYCSGSKSNQTVYGHSIYVRNSRYSSCRFCFR
jgi:DNA-binding protein H-NS